MTIVEFKREHAERIKLQAKQAALRLPTDVCLVEQGVAVSGLDGEQVIFCGGTYKQVVGKRVVTVLWAALSDAARIRLLPIVRCAERLLELSRGMGPVVMGVQNDFPEARRLAEMLKFELVEPGDPLSLYGRLC